MPEPKLSERRAPEPQLAQPARLASLDRRGLEDALRPLFEDAGPLAERLLGINFSTWDDVIVAAGDAVSDMSEDEQALLLRAHPRIGASPRQLARRSRLSWAEQGGDAAVPQDVTLRLAQLNEEYEARFGFPFVERVAGRSRAALIPVMEMRGARDRRTELAAGCAALVAIAGDRLARLRSTGI